MTSTTAPNPQLEGVTHFRYGEVFVIFRRDPLPPPIDKGGIQGLTDELNDPGFYRDVVQAFGGAGVALYRDVPFRNKVGKPVAFAATTRGTQVLGFGQIALAEWTPDLEHINERGSNDPPGLDEAKRAVPAACEKLNQQPRQIRVREWELIAATPHWRVAALCDGTTGGPGGRPVMPPEPKAFRRNHVLWEVMNRLDAYPSGNLTGEKVRVAILDTWPMDDEPALEVGGQPDNPLGKIRAFLGDPNNGAAANNPHLQHANAETLVHHTKFRDYVSGQATKSPPHRRYNFETHSFEPFYEVPDHGLHVAGVINNIAPGAELAVYRVLSNYGSADLQTIALALTQAIQDARDDDKKLIINLSLTVGPPMRTISSLLAQPVATQTMAAWRPIVEAAGTLLDANGAVLDPDATYYSEDPTKPGEALILNNDGLIKRDDDVEGVPVWRLTGPLAAIDYLFRLDEELDVFVVASAGNNSHKPDGKVFGPRLPAFVEGVLGVSSIGGDYSNKDDIEEARDDGMGARGGRAATPDPGDPDSTSDTVQGEGVVGPGIAPRLPPEKRYFPGDLPLSEPSEVNHGGWVEWAGTSFAAPILSGLAAILWDEKLRGDPSYPTHKLMKDMIGTPVPRRSVGLRQYPL